jgi:heme a synthase
VSLPARRTGFGRLAAVTAAMALLLVAIGGAVRATDSGLACPTWPGCFSAGDFLPPAGLNVWLEHTHRLVAGVVGIMVAVQAVWAIKSYRHRRGILVLALVAAVAVVVQAGLGALVVLHLLRAELVTAHLGMAMLVVACLLAIAVQTAPDRPAPGTATRPFARAAAGVAALTLLQILVGGHVTGTGAGLVYAGGNFPFLGVITVAPIDSQPAAFNVAHRVLAVLLAAAVMWLIAYARRTGQQGWLLRLPRIAAWLVVLQIAIGIGNLATQLSFLTVIPHLAVASWLWTALILTTVMAYRAIEPSSTSPAQRTARQRVSA